MITSIIVCIKPVYDLKNPLPFTEQRELDEKKLTRFVMDPQDESALEEALRLKAEIPSCGLSLVSISTETGDRVLREGLAVGADQAFRIWDSCLETADSLVLAEILAKAVKHLSAALVFTGCKSSHWGRGLVPSMLAERLGFAYLSQVRNIAYFPEGENLRLEQKIEKKTLLLKLVPPAVLSIKKSFPLRYPKALSRFKSQKREIPRLSLDELNVGESELTPLIKHSKIISPKPFKKAITPAAKTATGRISALLGQSAPKPSSSQNLLEGDPQKTSREAVAALIELNIVDVHLIH